VCPECSEEFNAYGDVAVEYIAHEWASEGREETYRETRADIRALFENEHDPGAFLEKTSGLPFLSKAVSGIDFGGEAEIA
jgi:hypothetical protein